MKHKQLLKFLKQSAPLPPPGELYNRWCAYCAEHGLKPGPDIGFAERVGDTLDKYLQVRAGGTLISPTSHSR